MNPSLLLIGVLLLLVCIIGLSALSDVRRRQQTRRCIADGGDVTTCDPDARRQRKDARLDRCLRRGDTPAHCLREVQHD